MARPSNSMTQSPMKNTRAVGKRKSSVSLTDRESMLANIPLNSPPSLVHRIQDASTLFTYFACRGNGEIMLNAKAVDKALEGPRAAAKPRPAPPKVYALDLQDNSVLFNAPVLEREPLANTQNPAEPNGGEDTAGTVISISIANPFTSGKAPSGSELNPFRTAMVERGRLAPPGGHFSYAEIGDTSTSSGAALGEQDRSNEVGSVPLPLPVREDPENDPTRRQLLAERHWVVPRLPPVEEPLCPRLGGAAAFEKTVYQVRRKQEAKEEAIKKRREEAALAPSEVYYTSLYRPASTIGEEIEKKLLDALNRAEAAEKKLLGQSAPLNTNTLGPSPTANLTTTNPRRQQGGASGHYTAGTSPRHGASGRPLSIGSGAFESTWSSQGGFATSRSVDQSPKLDASARTSGRLALSYKNFSVAATSPAEMRNRPLEMAEEVRTARRKVRQDLADAFVGRHQIQHPELSARRPSYQSNSKRNTLQGSTALSTDQNKKRSKKRRAATPPREGEPQKNLLLIKNALLAVADESGLITLPQLHEVFRDVPFEVRNPEAIDVLFQCVQQESETRRALLNPADPVAAAMGTSGGDEGTNLSRVGGGGELESSLQLNSSKRSLAQSPANEFTPSGTAASRPTPQNLTRSGKDFQPSERIRRSTSLQNLRRSSISLVRDASNAHHNITESVVGLEVPETKEPAFGGSVYVREVLAGIDALVNSPRTFHIVRWESFQTLALAGQGYVHKNILANIRRMCRAECEDPNEALTPSIVKALLDCFDVVAAEEEAAYLKSISKGRKKRKPPPLAAHQKSIIPLHVMRRAHVPFKEFCQYFERLPQVAAAFMHVWLPLLLVGQVAPRSDLAIQAYSVRATVPEPPVAAPTVPNDRASIGGSRSTPSHQSIQLNSSHGKPSVGAGPVLPGGDPEHSDPSPQLITSVEDIGSAEEVKESPEPVPEPATATESPLLNEASKAASPQDLWKEEVEKVEPDTFPILLLGVDPPARCACAQQLVTQAVEEIRVGFQSYGKSLEHLRVPSEGVSDQDMQPMIGGESTGEL